MSSPAIAYSGSAPIDNKSVWDIFKDGAESVYQWSGRITRIFLRCLAVVVVAGCGSLLWPVATVGFVARLVCQENVDNVLRTLGRAFSQSVAQGFMLTCTAFILLPVTVLIAAFTYGVALNVLWTSDKQQFSDLGQAFLS